VALATAIRRAGGFEVRVIGHRDRFADLRDGFGIRRRRAPTRIGIRAGAEESGAAAMAPFIFLPADFSFSPAASPPPAPDAQICAPLVRITAGGLADRPIADTPQVMRLERLGRRAPLMASSIAEVIIRLGAV
jgi:hypothetical protein